MGTIFIMKSLDYKINVWELQLTLIVGIRLLRWQLPGEILEMVFMCYSKSPKQSIKTWFASMFDNYNLHSSQIGKIFDSPNNQYPDGQLTVVTNAVETELHSLNFKPFHLNNNRIM